MFRWNEEKNLLLVIQRGVSFYDVVEQIKSNKVLDNYKHPRSDKYPNQYIFVIVLNDYVHYVPYVMNRDEIFLKNIIPSRKLNKIYNKDK